MTRQAAISRASLAVLALLAGAAAVLAKDDADARFRGTGRADPIRIGNVRLTKGPVAGQTFITCDVAWDHSWREAWEVPEEAYSLFHPHPIFNRPQDQKWEGRPLKLENWDAAWVFVKFRAPGGEWRHATLSSLVSDYGSPPGAALDVGLSDDPDGSGTSPSTALGAGGKRGLGVFLHRDGAGSGPNNWKEVKLLWRNGADGVPDPGGIEIKVLGIKMVYVPQGTFWAGDGTVTDPAARFYEGASKNTSASWRTADIAAQFSAGDTSYPLRIDSEKALTLGGESVTNLCNRNGWGLLRGEDFNRSVTQPLPAKFPKGVAAFYCMRDELTEGQYVEFLNTLTFAQQRDRTLVCPDAPIGSISMCLTNSERWPLCRNSVKIAVPGVPVPPAQVVSRDDGVRATISRPVVPAVYRTDSPDAACGHIVWSDVVAYSGWAGLRPMTELEYEKACRGPLKPVPGEYAWGANSITGDKKHKARYEIRSAGKPDEHVVLVGGEGAGNAAWWGTLGTPGGADDEDEVAVTNLQSDSGEVPGVAAAGEQFPAAEKEEADDEAPGQVTAQTAPGAPLRGPLRAGAFAAPHARRADAGASYWGILDLSGNLWELTITVGNESGRRFAGTHGDGTPNPSPFWHLGYRGSAAPSRAFRLRGGSFGWQGDHDNLMLRTSDRAATSSGGGNFRPGQTSVGLRCVRTAP